MDENESEDKNYLGSPFVYGLRPHPAFWLPVRCPENSAQEWARSWGKVEFRLRPGPRIGVPYGQDRLILILLVSLAVKQPTRKLQLPSGFQILRFFGLPPSGRNYSRLAERLARFRYTEFTVVTESVAVSGQICEQAALHFGSGASANGISCVECDRADRNCEERLNSMTLSESFWQLLRNNATPLELRVIRSLSNSPSTLDFYSWLAARSYIVRPDRFARVPLFGYGGLCQLMGTSDLADRRGFRKQVRKWLAHLRECWLQCPAVLADGEDTLVVCRVPPPRIGWL